VAAELVQQLIDQNARVAQNQEDYQRRYDEMFTRYEDAEKALTAAQGSLHQKEKQTEQIESFIAEVESLPDCITEFRTDYWGHLVEKVTVHRKGTMTFSFACGVEIQV
jgi:DNA repair exonuclease SbcCD ATPase subunit